MEGLPILTSLRWSMLSLAVETFLFLKKDREHPAEQTALINQICPNMSTCWCTFPLTCVKGLHFPPGQSPLHVQCFCHVPSLGINVNTHFLNLLYLCLLWPLFQLPVIMRSRFSAHLLGQISSWKLLLVLDGTFSHFSPRIPIPLEIDLCICFCFQVVPPKCGFLPSRWTLLPWTQVPWTSVSQPRGYLAVSTDVLIGTTGVECYQHLVVRLLNILVSKTTPHS